MMIIKNVEDINFNDERDNFIELFKSIYPMLNSKEKIILLDNLRTAVKYAVTYGVQNDNNQ